MYQCLYLFIPTEGLSHAVSGARARESQSSAGHQNQTAPPAGEEADGDRQTGETDENNKTKQYH